jgi:hypothetical protein
LTRLLLDEKIVELGSALDAARVPHAFGGALALAYYGTPRGTVDIDLNAFLPAERAGPVLDLLTPLGVTPPGDAQVREIGDRAHTQLRWDGTPLDLFFSYDPLHDSAAKRRRRVPFGDGVEIAILSAEDLAIFKALFDRAKDWTDLGEMLFAQGPRFDADYALRWLRRILAPDDARLARFEALVGGEAGEGGKR